MFVDSLKALDITSQSNYFSSFSNEFPHEEEEDKENMFDDSLAQFKRKRVKYYRTDLSSTHAEKVSCPLCDILINEQLYYNDRVKQFHQCHLDSLTSNAWNISRVNHPVVWFEEIQLKSNILDTKEFVNNKEKSENDRKFENTNNEPSKKTETSKDGGNTLLSSCGNSEIDNKNMNVTKTVCVTSDLQITNNSEFGYLDVRGKEIINNKMDAAKEIDNNKRLILRFSNNNNNNNNNSSSNNNNTLYDIFGQRDLLFLNNATTTVNNNNNNKFNDFDCMKNLRLIVPFIGGSKKIPSYLELMRKLDNLIISRKDANEPNKCIVRRCGESFEPDFVAEMRHYLMRKLSNFESEGLNFETLMIVALLGFYLYYNKSYEMKKVYHTTRQRCYSYTLFQVLKNIVRFSEQHINNTIVVFGQVNNTTFENVREDGVKFFEIDDSLEENINNMVPVSPVNYDDDIIDDPDFALMSKTVADFDNSLDTLELLINRLCTESLSSTTNSEMNNAGDFEEEETMPQGIDTVKCITLKMTEFAEGNARVVKESLWESLVVSADDDDDDSSENENNNNNNACTELTKENGGLVLTTDQICVLPDRLYYNLLGEKDGVKFYEYNLWYSPLVENNVLYNGLLHHNLHADTPIGTKANFKPYQLWSSPCIGNSIFQQKQQIQIDDESGDDDKKNDDDILLESDAVYDLWASPDIMKCLMNESSPDDNGIKYSAERSHLVERLRNDAQGIVVSSILKNWTAEKPETPIEEIRHQQQEEEVVAIPEYDMFKNSNSDNKGGTHAGELKFRKLQVQSESYFSYFSTEPVVGSETVVGYQNSSSITTDVDDVTRSEPEHDAVSRNSFSYFSDQSANADSSYKENNFGSTYSLFGENIIDYRGSTLATLVDPVSAFVPNKFLNLPKNVIDQWNIDVASCEVEHVAHIWNDDVSSENARRRQPLRVNEYNLFPDDRGGRMEDLRTYLEQIRSENGLQANQDEQEQQPSLDKEVERLTFSITSLPTDRCMFKPIDPVTNVNVDKQPVFARSESGFFYHEGLKIMSFEHPAETPQSNSFKPKFKIVKIDKATQTEFQLITNLICNNMEFAEEELRCDFINLSNVKGFIDECFFDVTEDGSNFNAANVNVVAV